MTPDEIKAKLLQMAENWIDAQGGKIEDVSDYRRIVQCVTELTREDDDAAQTIRVIMNPAASQYAD